MRFSIHRFLSNHVAFLPAFLYLSSLSPVWFFSLFLICLCFFSTPFISPLPLFSFMISLSLYVPSFIVVCLSIFESVLSFSSHPYCLSLDLFLFSSQYVASSFSLYRSVLPSVCVCVCVCVCPLHMYDF